MGKLAAVAVLVAGGCAGAPMPAGDDDGVEVDATGDVAEPDAAPPAAYTAILDGCDDAIEDLYVTPARSSGERGEVVRCVTAASWTADELVEALEGADGVTPTTGVRLYKIAYRTARSGGAEAVTTANVWLPDAPRGSPAPVALVARSTVGIADDCAPTREENPLHELALPLAARGFVVIAPDFAGLGNQGGHAYLDNREAAGQLFDGHVALGRLTAGLGDAVVAVGYSQGGGVALSAQALEAELTGARTLRGVVAIAPQWPIRLDSFDYEQVLRNPDRATVLAGLAPPTVTVLRHYGWFVNQLGPEHGGDAFPADERADLLDQVESLCTIELGGALDARQPTLGDLVDETFRVAMLACIDGDDAGCTEPARGFHAWLDANLVTADPAGADVLVVQGLGDQVMPPASEAACGVAKLRAEGVEPAVCSDAWSTHDSILENRIEHAVAWAEAAADGAPRPTCGSDWLPACSP